MQPSGNGHKRAVLYARVSTDEQADKGYSLPSQLDLCRKYAECIGYPIVAELREDFTGKVPIYERPEGRKLAAMLKDKQASAVIAYQVDRLSRDNVDLLIAVRMWRQSGIELHTVETGKIENENNILLIIKGWQASEEHGRIKERLRRGALAKTRDGKITAVGGHAPYGYRFDGTTYAIVEGEARIVKLIFVWYVIGDDSGKRLSAGVIAKRLSEMRIQTPGETRIGRKRTRGNGMWGTAEVLNILSSEKYAGVWRYGDVTQAIPAIVDRKLWEAAQACKAYNKQMASRNTKRTYLLRGMIRCAICDKAMTGIYDKRDESMRYRCSWMNNHHLAIESRKCSGKHINASEVETQAWEYIQQVIFGKDFERALKEAQQAEVDDLAPQRDELQAVESELKEADQEVEEIARAMRHAKEGGAVWKKFQAQEGQVNARVESLSRRRDELQAGLATRRLTDQVVGNLIQWRETQLRSEIELGREYATDEDKRGIFEMLRLEVWVSNGKVENMYCLVDPGSAIVPNLVCRGRCTETAAPRNCPA
jgi:site-specific DNA recombinase